MTYGGFPTGKGNINGLSSCLGVVAVCNALNATLSDRRPFPSCSVYVDHLYVKDLYVGRIYKPRFEHFALAKSMACRKCGLVC